jgi:hypothetical protein
MTIWRWAALVGLVALAISIGFGQIPGIHACSASGDAILNFEFVKTPAEVAALFPDNCRIEHVAAQRHGLWLDSLGFIPAYSAFLILSLVGLRTEDSRFAQRMTGTGIVLTLIAALCDQFEGIQLFRILGDLPGTQSTINLLMPAVRIKFGLLALVIILIGWFHLHMPSWRKAAGAIIAIGGLWSLAGLFIERDWLLQGSAVAWLMLLVANIILASRKVA